MNYNRDVIHIAKSNKARLTGQNLDAARELNWSDFLDSTSTIINEQGLYNTVTALVMTIDRNQELMDEDSQSYKDLQFARDILAAAASACDLNGRHETRRTALSNLFEDIANIEVLK